MKHNSCNQTLYQVCVQCLREQKESSFQFHKRTRNGYDMPFYCQRCRKDPIPYEDIILRRLLPKEIEKKKTEIRELIRRYQDNKKLADQHVAYIEDGKKKRAEYQKEYFETEKGKEAKANGWKKRALNLKKALEGIPDYEKDLVKDFYYNRPDGYEIDHIIPISKGGKHRLDNLRYIKAEDHRSKFDKIDPRYVRYALENEKISISAIMRKFGIAYEGAERIFNEIKNKTNL